MSIENNPAIEILNTVVTMKDGDLFVLVVSVIIVLTGIICMIAFIVDWVKGCGSMDGFGFIIAATIIFSVITGFNVYAMKHPVEVISYEVRFTDPDHFSLTDYEKLQENYTVVSVDGKIYTLKERADKDD
jgi:hypothetical protein